MGMKKHKERSADAATAIVSSPSDVFKNLFGDVEQNTAVSSIFTDSNPFKRTPQESLVNGDAEGSKVTEVKKRKGTEEANSDLAQYQDSVDEAREIPSGSKKTRKLKILKSSNEDELESTNFDYENKNNRKKRKRDDVEKEYEAKKYGAVLEDSENAVVVGAKRKKAENDADMSVSKDSEGFDDESKLLRTVFLGNLPLKVKKKAIIKEFSQFGEIESVRIRSVPIADTKIPRKGAVILKKFNDSADSVNAYVVFKTEESAQASLSHNMAMVAGNHIRVDRACPPRKKLKGEDASLYDNKRTIFVGNLPFDVKDEEIYQLFTGIKDLESSIEAVRVIRHSHIGLGKGIAYVLFKTREAANLAVRKRNLKIRNRELRISHARQGSTPSKRRNSFPEERADSPYKKITADSRTPDRNRGSNTKASISYQGLRATKPGVQKKVHPKQTKAFKVKSTGQKGETRKGKRPAVEARKAKSKAVKDGSGLKQAGQKRKSSNRTPDPESFKGSKKAKRFR